MADKARKFFPIGIDMGDGEQPSGKKLNAIATQARNGLAIAEFAIGDLWGQAGDSSLSNNPLQLTNLARMIGENKLLNPAIYPTFSNFTYTEDLSNKWAGKADGYLQFKPSSFDLTMVDTDDGSVLTTLTADDYDVTVSGEFHVNTDTGRFRMGTPVRSGDNAVVSYPTGATDEWLEMETLPGVIPDPRETTFSGLKFEESGGLWHISLPPRGPLTFSDSREMPVIYPPAAEYSNNYAATAAATPKKLWQDPTLSAFTGVDAIHYRYALPGDLASATNWANIPDGTRLPDGYLYLWNQTNETIVEGVIFYKADDNPDYSYRLRIETGSLDTTGLASADETSGSYNSGYSLITSGAPLARLLWEQKIQFLGHKHDNSGSLEPTMVHNSLTGPNPPIAEGNEHSSRYPTYLAPWTPSNWNNDDHTYLLSRAGSQTDSARERDQYNNAMLGHLLMANADTTDAHNYIDNTLPDNSFRILFGDVTGGPRLWGAANTGLNIDGPASWDGLTVNGGARGIVANGGTGLGVETTNGTSSDYFVYDSVKTITYHYNAVTVHEDGTPPYPTVLGATTIYVPFPVPHPGWTEGGGDGPLLYSVTVTIAQPTTGQGAKNATVGLYTRTYADPVDLGGFSPTGWTIIGGTADITGSVDEVDVDTSQFTWTAINEATDSKYFAVKLTGVTQSLFYILDIAYTVTVESPGFTGMTG